MNVIELKNINFTYDPDEEAVFTDLNLAVEAGTTTVIEGDNGAGKTTLFRILNGLSFPQSGTYIFNGTEINEEYLKDNRRAKQFHKQIGYLFQNPDIMLFNSRVYDEIAFGPRQMGLSDSEVEVRVKDCMELFQVEKLADKAPYHLSGGQKKRVALAAVMALNPEVLILDEPYAGLDRNMQEHLTDFLIDLKAAGKTVLIATHNPEVSEKVADRTVVLK